MIKWREVTWYSQIIAIVLFVGVFALGFYLGQVKRESIVEEPVIQGCTKELKICPDGTGVGRTGPNCSFAECPLTDSESPFYELYENKKIGFSITFNEDYRGYEVEEWADLKLMGHVATVRLIIPVREGSGWFESDYDIFTIAAFRNDWWDKNVTIRTNGYAFDKNEDGFTVGYYLGRNNQFSFAVNKGQDCPTLLVVGPNLDSTVECSLYHQVETFLKKNFKTSNI